jgi:D-alanyl-D-alanine-carboxypeptidase/D-alanyl-D-alanine-endopeptidase
MELSHKNTRAAEKLRWSDLGWHISPVADNKEMVWHNGGTGGYRSFCGFIKGENKGVVVLTSSAESVDDIGVHILNPSSPLNERKRQRRQHPMLTCLLLFWIPMLVNTNSLPDLS